MRPKFGPNDRLVRTLSGLALVAVFLVGHEASIWPLIAGLTMMVTAILDRCPFYWLLRLSTRSMPHELADL